MAETSATPLIEIDNVTAGYLPGVNILNGSMLELREGEIVGIIGPNGAGKSTLLKAILGQVTIREGVVRLRGKEINGTRASKLVSMGVAYVPQTNNVFPSLTIFENLQMGVFQKPAAFRDRMEQVLTVFPELKGRLDQKAGSLSGGERQMVAMSRALMPEPDVLLLDEPSAGLSPARQDESFLRVSEINRTGVGVLMVEQNARRCLQICDRGYVLDQGTVAYTDSGRNLLEDKRVIELYLGSLGA